MVTLIIKDCENKEIMTLGWSEHYVPQKGDSIMLYRGVNNIPVKVNILHRQFDTADDMRSVIILVTDYTDKLLMKK